MTKENFARPCTEYNRKKELKKIKRNIGKVSPEQLGKMLKAYACTYIVAQKSTQELIDVLNSPLLDN